MVTKYGKVSQLFNPSNQSHMDKIDLDAILKDKFTKNAHTKEGIKEVVKSCMKEAIHQALVLGSEKAKTQIDLSSSNTADVIDKQSILDVEKFIV